MIHILLTALILILPSAAFACASGNAEQRTAPENYSWRKVIESGKGCFQDSGCAQGQWAMALVPLAAFDKLFIIGRREVWSSADGINWTSQAKTDWGERHGMASVFLHNRMWMTGGMQSWDKFKNDVWYSTDGKRWQTAFAPAPWTTRGAEYSVVFAGKLWLFGGKTGRADSRAESGDVWIMSSRSTRNHVLR